MATKRFKVGLVGCGNISGQYLRSCRNFPVLEVVACADLDLVRAQEKAAEFAIPKAYTYSDMLADPEVEIVINLTIPSAHAEVNLAAIQAGKHVHGEKPLAITREDGRRTLEAAQAAGVRLGCAPDTFLGGGLQTCRKLIDDGWIGRPVAAAAFMMGHGPENWHPNPAFFYHRGAGPLFDVGPYYITALVTLLGPIGRVTASTRISQAERMITSQPFYGQMIQVEAPTHVAGVLDFESGPIATLITSFDVWASAVPRIEIYGTEGTLGVPDPNIFGGPVRLRRAGAADWSEIPLTHPAEVNRGIGVADLAYGLLYDRPHRASGDLAYHVLDVMAALEEASEFGRHIQIESGVPRPAPLPMRLRPGELD
jgi:predicted dehydrogenase